MHPGMEDPAINGAATSPRLFSSEAANNYYNAMTTRSILKKTKKKMMNGMSRKTGSGGGDDDETTKKKNAQKKVDGEKENKSGQNKVSSNNSDEDNMSSDSGSSNGEGDDKQDGDKRIHYSPTEPTGTGQSIMSVASSGSNDSSLNSYVRTYGPIDIDTCRKHKGKRNSRMNKKGDIIGRRECVSLPKIIESRSSTPSSSHAGGNIRSSTLVIHQMDGSTSSQVAAKPVQESAKKEDIKPTADVVVGEAPAKIVEEKKETTHVAAEEPKEQPTEPNKKKGISLKEKCLTAKSSSPSLKESISISVDGKSNDTPPAALDWTLEEASETGKPAPLVAIEEPSATSYEREVAGGKPAATVEAADESTDTPTADEPIATDEKPTSDEVTAKLAAFQETLKVMEGGENTSDSEKKEGSSWFSFIFATRSSSPVEQESRAEQEPAAQPTEPSSEEEHIPEPNAKSPTEEPTSEPGTDSSPGLTEDKPIEDEAKLGAEDTASKPTAEEEKKDHRISVDAMDQSYNNLDEQTESLVVAVIEETKKDEANAAASSKSTTKSKRRIDISMKKLQMMPQKSTTNTVDTSTSPKSSSNKAGMKAKKQADKKGPASNNLMAKVKSIGNTTMRDAKGSAAKGSAKKVKATVDADEKSSKSNGSSSKSSKSSSNSSSASVKDNSDDKLESAKSVDNNVRKASTKANRSSKSSKKAKDKSEIGSPDGNDDTASKASSKASGEASSGNNSSGSKDGNENEDDRSSKSSSEISTQYGSIGNAKNDDKSKASKASKAATSKKSNSGDSSGSCITGVIFRSTVSTADSKSKAREVCNTPEEVVKYLLEHDAASQLLNKTAAKEQQQNSGAVSQKSLKKSVDNNEVGAAHPTTIPPVTSFERPELLSVASSMTHTSYNNKGGGTTIALDACSVDTDFVPEDKKLKSIVIEIKKASSKIGDEGVDMEEEKEEQDQLTNTDNGKNEKNDNSALESTKKMIDNENDENKKDSDTTPKKKKGGLMKSLVTKVLPIKKSKSTTSSDNNQDENDNSSNKREKDDAGFVVSCDSTDDSTEFSLKIVAVILRTNSSDASTAASPNPSDPAVEEEAIKEDIVPTTAVSCDSTDGSTEVNLKDCCLCTTNDWDDGDTKTTASVPRVLVLLNSVSYLTDSTDGSTEVNLKDRCLCTTSDWDGGDAKTKSSDVSTAASSNPSNPAVDEEAIKEDIVPTPAIVAAVDPWAASIQPASMCGVFSDLQDLASSVKKIMTFGV